MNLEKAAESYGKLLEGMEAQCSAILKDTGKVNDAVDAATRAQDRLYEAANKSRIQAATTLPATTDPKVLIKGLGQKL